VKRQEEASISVVLHRSPRFASRMAAEASGESKLSPKVRLGKGWLSALPRFPRLAGCRAELLLESPLAKRVESGSSKSVDSEDLY